MSTATGRAPETAAALALLVRLRHLPPAGNMLEPNGSDGVVLFPRLVKRCHTMTGSTPQMSPGSGATSGGRRTPQQARAASETEVSVAVACSLLQVALIRLCTFHSLAHNPHLRRFLRMQGATVLHPVATVLATAKQRRLAAAVKRPNLRPMTDARPLTHAKAAAAAAESAKAQVQGGRLRVGRSGRVGRSRRWTRSRSSRCSERRRSGAA